jgi:hypothetical protein
LSVEKACGSTNERSIVVVLEVTEDIKVFGFGDGEDELFKLKEREDGEKLFPVGV